MTALDPTPDLTPVVSVPLDTIGTTATAKLPTVRLASGEFTAETVFELAKVLAESKAPFNLMVAQEITPVLVTTAEAARLLGTHEGYVDDLIRNGWLRYTHTRSHLDRRTSRVTTPEVAEATGDYTGWQQLISYASVVDLADHALQTGHLPHSSQEPDPTVRKPGDRPAVAATARNIMEERYRISGPEAWLTPSQLTDAVVARLGDRYYHARTRKQRWEACYKTVQSALTTGPYSMLRKGCVERRRIPGQDMDVGHVNYQYRWLPVEKRADHQKGGWAAHKAAHKLRITHRPRRYVRAQCTCEKWDELYYGLKADGVRKAKADHIAHVHQADLLARAKAEATSEGTAE